MVKSAYVGIYSHLSMVIEIPISELYIRPCFKIRLNERKVMNRTKTSPTEQVSSIRQVLDVLLDL